MPIEHQRSPPPASHSAQPLDSILLVLALLHDFTTTSQFLILVSLSLFWSNQIAMEDTKYAFYSSISNVGVVGQMSAAVCGWG